MGPGGPLSTGYGAGWGLAAVAGAFALVVVVPQLNRGASEGLEVFARAVVLLPFVVLLLVVAAVRAGRQARSAVSDGGSATKVEP